MNRLIKLALLLVLPLGMGCTAKDWGAFFEGFDKGYSEGQASREAVTEFSQGSGSVSSSQGSPVVQNVWSAQDSNCRVSPAGQKVCSNHYRVSDSDLTYIDRAWFKVLSCVKGYNPKVTVENIRTPIVNVIRKDQVSIWCGIGAIGCYDFSSENIWISPEPENFTAIYMEYGHHIDKLAGLQTHSERHGFNTYSIQCSYSPLSSWWHQSDYLKEILGTQPHN